jgi:hypothetical protein
MWAHSKEIRIRNKIKFLHSSNQVRKDHRNSAWFQPGNTSFTIEDTETAPPDVAIATLPRHVFGIGKAEGIVADELRPQFRRRKLTSA